MTKRLQNYYKSVTKIGEPAKGFSAEKTLDIFFAVWYNSLSKIILKQ